ncbi:MAG: hypothetical protein H6696_04240 [Deferribacteres bacterium]|nr:hypothetical protein [Deferribacteres bacterium]
MKKNKSCISVILLAAFFLHSCSSWNAINMEALTEIAEKPITQIRLKNGEKIETRNYHMAGDTLVIKAMKSLFYTGAERRIPPDEIEQIRILENDWKRSLKEIEKKPITQIRLKDGEKIETRNYYFVHDTLVIKASKSLFYSDSERRIAPNEIEQMRVLEIDWRESVVLTVISAVLIWAIWQAMAAYSHAFQGLGT